MTTQILRHYADEDLKFIIDNGNLAITDTVYKFPLWFNFENKTFTVSKNNGEILLQTNKKSLVRSFIQNSYKMS